MAIEDVLYVVIALFTVGVMTILAAQAFYILDTNPRITSAFGDTGAPYIDKGVETIQSFDYLILLLFFFYVIATIITAYMAPVHPIFFIGAFLLASLQLIIVTFFENLFRYFIEATVFSSMFAVWEFPFLTLIFEKIAIFVWIHTILILIVMFARTDRGTDILGGGSR